MRRFVLLTAAAVAGSVAGSASAQYQQPYQPSYPPQYQQPYQQQYPDPYQQQYDPYQQQYGQPYGQQGYGYPDQYGNQNVVGSFIDQLVGNRYDVSDRQAIRRCGFAAVREAENRYQRYFNGMPYAYQGYRSHVRVSDITSVQRRLLVVRVKGYLDTTRRGNRDWNRRDRGDADLSFRCDVDRNGNVSDLRVERTRYWRD